MIACDGERCRLEGPLTLANVVAVLEEGRRTLPALPRLVIDLKDVTEVDSSAVSLLLEWRRAAQREKRTIEFVNLPASLQSLAALYGVAEMLDGRQ
jgi:phospholipid transport system transporter-binding protein